MAGLFTVSDGFTSSVHPTLFPHQVSELSETEQRERLKNAFFDCLRKMNSDPVTLTGRLFFTSFVDFSFRELDSTSLCVFLPHPLCIKKKFNARSLCIFAMCVLCACVCVCVYVLLSFGFFLFFFFYKCIIVIYFVEIIVLHSAAFPLFSLFLCVCGGGVRACVRACVRTCVCVCVCVHLFFVVLIIYC